jgi:hypothetical protein
MMSGPPISCSSLLTPRLYGMSEKGTKLFVKTYDEEDDFAPQVYSYLTVNAKTGALGKPVEFWEDESAYGAPYSAFSDQVLAQLTPDYAAPMAVNRHLFNFWRPSTSSDHMYVCHGARMRGCLRLLRSADTPIWQVPILSRHDHERSTDTLHQHHPEETPSILRFHTGKSKDCRLQLRRLVGICSGRQKSWFMCSTRIRGC